MNRPVQHYFTVSEAIGDVTGLLTRPPGAEALYVFAHGAGAGMRHAFMDSVAARLADRRIATFRYHFPYMELGRWPPNRAPMLTATVRAAVVEATRLAPDLPLVAGGKSLGGRMTSTAASEEELPGVKGIAFFGFPLHAAGKPSSKRGDHLAEVGIPMLFLQGTRDKLADLALLRPLVETVEPRPTLHVVEGADHGFQVLKRSGRTDEEVLDEVCDEFARWARRLG